MLKWWWAINWTKKWYKMIYSEIEIKWFPEEWIPYGDIYNNKSETVVSTSFWVKCDEQLVIIL